MPGPVVFVGPPLMEPPRSERKVFAHCGLGLARAQAVHRFSGVREFNQSSLGLSGSLLIAHPNLLDPNFRRTVLYIALHDASDGSFGLVLNRETDKTVGDLVDEPGLGLLGKIPVFLADRSAEIS